MPTPDEFRKIAIDHYNFGGSTSIMKSIFWMLEAIYEQNKLKGGN